ncbi:glutamate-1-semialdehyde 2,1-aminomutase 2, chloroplastic-like [Fagus crenata]
MVAPAGPMYQVGTLSGNLLALTAGIHTLKRLQKPGTYKYLDKITEGPVYNFEDAKKSDTAKFARFYRGMLEEGVYFAPSQFEAGFTSLVHTPEDIQKTIAAAEKVLQQI